MENGGGWPGQRSCSIHSIHPRGGRSWPKDGYQQYHEESASEAKRRDNVRAKEEKWRWGGKSYCCPPTRHSAPPPCTKLIHPHILPTLKATASCDAGTQERSNAREAVTMHWHLPVRSAVTATVIGPTRIGKTAPRIRLPTYACLYFF